MRRTQRIPDASGILYRTVRNPDGPSNGCMVNDIINFFSLPK